MRLSREVKTGIIVLGGVLLFILGLSYLKSAPIFDSSKTFYAVYHSVAGLQPGTQVMINGYGVGTVNSIEFLDAKGNLLVTFSVNSKFGFSKNSPAQLYDTGIIGGKGIQIIPVFDDAPMAVSGDTLPSRIKPGLTDLVQSRLTPLQLKLEDAVSNADSLMINVNEVLDYNSKKELRESIRALHQLMESLQKTAVSLNSILDGNKVKLQNSIANFEKVTDNFAALSDSLKNAGMARTLASLEESMANLDQLMAKIKKGEGTMGKLVNDEQLYTNLNKTSKELNLLLQDFRLNPKRYVNVSVFGKKQKEYTLPDGDPAKKNE